MQWQSRQISKKTLPMQYKHFNNPKPFETKFSVKIFSKMCDVEVMQSPIKSESDKKSYRIIRLSNGLRALLISDSEVEDEGSDAWSDVESDGDDDQEGSDDEERQAACSLCVDVGSFSDPRDVEGLSHFLGMMNNYTVCMIFAYLPFVSYSYRAYDFDGFEEVPRRK